MFCGNCGKEIPDNAKFCNHCGAVQNNITTRGSTSPQQAYTSARTNPASSSKLSIGAKFNVILAVVVMVSAATVIAYWGDIFGKKQPDISAPNNTASSNHYAESKQPEGLDEELYPFYALLSDKKKVVYEEALVCIENGGNVSEIIPGYNNLADDLVYNQRLIEGVTDWILSENSALSDLEAERFFHDYICMNTAYQLGTYDQTIYSVFVENKTVCSGYTRALQYLMMKRGMQSCS